jgi:hypothetical protein
MRGFYVHNSSGGSDFAVAGRTTHLALQPGVGILPERRAGIDRRNCDHPALGGTALM